MTLEDFKIVAARKLDVEPEKIRVTTKVIDKYFEPNEILDLTETEKSIAYIQNICCDLPELGNFTAMLNDENGLEIMLSKADQKTNFFAKRLINSDFGAYAQITAYIAERLF
jgi:hypothetical protein